MIEFAEVFERQRELIRQLGEDLDRIVEVFGKIKTLAKREPNEPRIKVSPYAKFDKYHKKNRKRK